ncbi:MAG: putative lipoprotein, partial [Alphaproteobacteria bacterium]|nr:putative lipoprotein [Alphaproteobacteria bacterium]
AKQLADRASYRLVTTGNPPEIALIISLNVRNKPLIEILRDIGLQLGGRAQLKVDATQRVIEISYSNVQVDPLAADKVPLRKFNDGGPVIAETMDAGRVANDEVKVDDAL